MKSKILKNNLAPLIYVWIGTKIPKWGLDSLRFSSSYNPNRKIILLVDKNSFRTSKIKQNFAEVVLLDDKFLRNCLLPSDNNLSNSFWIYTAKRLKVLYEYCKKNKIEQFFHAEIDNLIFNLDGLEDKLNLQGEGFFAPKDSEERALASLIFCNNNESISRIFEYFSPPFYAKSEMNALGQFSINSQNFYSLPTESFSEVKRKWLVVSPEDTGGIFDAAAIGQFIFGVDPIHEPYRPLYNMFVNENVLIRFSDVEFFLKNKSLYINYKKTSKIFKIYNIHVHSKNIKKVESLIIGDNKILTNLNLGKKTLITNRHKLITGKMRKLYSYLRKKFFN